MRKACSPLIFMCALSVFILFLVLTFLVAACLAQYPQSERQYPQSERQQEAGVLPVGQTGNWTMIFHDEFNGNALDSTKWITCYFNFTVGNGCDHDQGELELYQPNEVFVSNGTLKLRAEKRTIRASNGKTYHYTSGMITTGPTAASSNDIRFSFQYGYMEMRAKVPRGNGLWPAFWALPADLSWPPEIDVFEIIGNAPNIINMSYHSPTASGDDRDSSTAWAGPDFSAGWHTYAVDWEPNAITWYVDGVERGSYTDTANITSKSMYLLADLAVGGVWPGSPDNTTQFPAYLEIDYIRVWQRGASSVFTSTPLTPSPMSGLPVFLTSMLPPSVSHQKWYAKGSHSLQYDLRF